MTTLEQNTVADVIAHVPGIAQTLREYRIDPSSHMRLAHAAAAVSANADEILAVAEVRMRRAARLSQVTHFEAEYSHLDERAFALA
jgi:iron-sulfur cluster repair protein YtfE (RIC family)